MRLFKQGSSVRVMWNSGSVFEWKENLDFSCLYSVSLALAKTDKDLLAWLQKRDKGAEKKKIGQNSCKLEAKMGEGAGDGKVEN